MRGKEGEKGSKKDGIRGIGGPYPKTMTITIRKGDWDFRNEPLFNLHNMLRNRHWENVLGGLKKLRIELEVEDTNKESLVPVINKLKESAFNIGDGEWLVAEENVKESGWTGPVKRHLAYPQEDEWEETRYYVATLVWKMRSIGQGLEGEIPNSALG